MSKAKLRALPLVFLMWCLVLGLPAQQPIGAELLTDTTFETGFASWNVTSGQFGLAAYGAPNVPSMTVSSEMGAAGHPTGGFFLLVATGNSGYGNATMQQVIDVSGNAPMIQAQGLELRLAGCFGGRDSDNDTAQLRARFKDASGALITPWPFATQAGSISRTHRNWSTTLIRAESVWPIPPTTETIEIEIWFDDASNGNTNPSCFCDNVSAMLVPAGQVAAQLPLNTNLLDKSDFEYAPPASFVINPGLAERRWAVSSGSFTWTPYGAGAPSTAVSAAIGGGTYMLEAYRNDGYGNAIMVQSADVSGHATDIDAGNLEIELSGYFGGVGSDNDRAKLEAHFYDGQGNNLPTPMGQPIVGDVTATHRNHQNILLFREGRFPIVAGTRRIDVRIWFDDATNGNTVPTCLCDNLAACLVPAGQPTPAVPLDTNLLDKNDFEDAPPAVNFFLDPAGGGWSISSGRMQTVPYGSGWPSTAVSAEMSGGTYMLRALANDGYGNAYMGQSFDVSGNAAEIDAGNLEVELSGYFGGIGSDNDRAKLEAYFYDSSNANLLTPLGQPRVGDISSVHRNHTNMLLYRTGRFPVVMGTRRIYFRVWLDDSTNGNTVPSCVCDNLDARLVTAGQIPPPQMLNTNLLDKPGFENQGASSHFLNPAIPNGWTVSVGRMVELPYGGSGLPGPAVSQAVNGGGFMLGANGNDGYGNAYIGQTFDLRGNEPEVAAGHLEIHLAGYFGGVGSDNDRARLRAYFYDDLGANITNLPYVASVGNVTASERGNVSTLLFRQGVFPVPPLARRMTLQVQFDDATNGNTVPTSLCDNLVAELRDITAPPVAYPGTGDDLDLFTGINALPTGGPGQDVKTATGGDVLTVLVNSTYGTFGPMPLFIGAHVFGTGSPPAPLFPDIHVNPLLPGFFWLVDGNSSNGGLGPVLLMSQGNMMQYQLPGGLAGQSVLLQAAVTTPLAGNGGYATTNGHEIQFQ